MKAVVYRRYGSPDVLEIEDVEMPDVGDDDVRIRVRAASVNPLDWHFMRGEPYLMRLAFGLRAPKRQRLGVDVAGVVDAVGKNVTELKPGDEVFGSCRDAGAFAEYAIATASSITPKPSNLTWEQAGATRVAGLTALQSLRRVPPARTVLINGASGGVGTFAVQIAKHHGAHVTGVCSTRNVDLVRSLGADEVIDYTRDDFTARQYDLIVDMIGNRSLSACKRALTPNGAYVAVGVPTGRWLRPIPRILAIAARARMSMMLTKESKDDSAALSELLASGRLTPVIDRTYRLNEIAEAVRYVETGRARGKVVVTVEGGS